ncbi:FtsK/SpoIIIE domain-containing protein [Herbiconiux sp. UC225_62]|uniref:FtsK/SpoIIIE domain-containing protein n=1 Tax=Herbiconiux sp. UC225_62 TaxID=3350168 RepID=UPI0036D28951
MRLKFTLLRGSAPAADIVVTTDATASVGDLAAAVADADPLATGRRAGAVTLAVSPPAFARESVLAPTTPIGEAEIGSGFTVRVTAPTDPRAADPEIAPGGVASETPAVIARVITGPDAGREFPLAVGESTIGRDPACTIVLTDPLASKVHAKVLVGDVIEVADLNSANGLLIDGGIVTRVTVDQHQSVTIGDSEIGFRRVARPQGAGAQPETGARGPVERGGVLPFNRAPRVESRYPGREFQAPVPPSEPEKMRFPWISLLAPLVTGAAMFALFQSAFALLFVALAPILVLGSYLDGGMNRRRRLGADTARFDEELHDLSAELAAEVPTERAVRNAEAPTTAEIYADAMQLGPLLWTRRPEHWSFLNLRLGTGTLPSRNTVGRADDSGRAVPELGRRVDEVLAPFADIADVPLVENPRSSGGIGVVGPDAVVADVARGLLVQVAGLHSPAEVVLAAITSARWSPEFAWLGWLPHTSSPQSPLGDQVHLADSAATGTTLLASLEALVEARGGNAVEPASRGALGENDDVSSAGGRVGQPGGGGSDASSMPRSTTMPAVVLLVTDDAPVDRARLVQLAERAADANVFLIWAAPSARDLPAVCRSWIDLAAGAAGSAGSAGATGTAGATGVAQPRGASVALVRLGRAVPGVQCERIDLAQATALARRLAPLVDSGARISDSSDLPPTVSFLALVGTEFAEAPAAVIDRWQQSRAGSLRALVGNSGVDAMHLDLRAQGPHALVGGTTGSGKSEFLQAWVLGMAAEYSPDRVTFLFVDYKGGSAFAECVSLPHAVGLVTDLSPHLVRRALTSLRAELQHRERLLGRKKAKDLLELEKRGDPEAPPALVIVIDEFAALATDVPEFVDGVVDIAQRGRSLGIHLIMATQRPAGVIKDNLRANTNLRVALRMADEHDSTDVIGEKTAAFFHPALPGRAVAKTGPGKVTPFQAAYVGGWTHRGPERASVKVAELRFGAEIVWEPRVTDSAALRHDETGPNDESRLVATIGTAAAVAGVPAPRRPWLDELAASYDLAALPSSIGADLVLGLADLPERQAQEPVAFRPDADGHLAVYGTGGSGKTVTLRTIAAAASLATDGRVEIHALDFAGGGLRMLEQLPTVGSVIAGDDPERVSRLLRMLAELLDDRGRRFSAMNAGSLDEYRVLAGASELPRVLLLIDGFPAFRAEWETASGRLVRYGEFQRVLAEGRRLGVHVVFTADRPGSVPSSVSSAVPRRVVLRMSDESSYLMLDTPDDVLGPASPAGRAVIDGHETQIAVLGGSRNVLEQAGALERLGAELRARGVADVAAVGSLPTDIPLAELPVEVAGRPALGVADDDLAPLGFDPIGLLLVAGGPASGRTNALLVLAQSLRRWRPGIALYYLGQRRSALVGAVPWTETATDPDAVAQLARRLATEIAAAEGAADAAASGATAADATTAGPLVVVVESIADFLSTPADAAIVELIRAVKRSEHLLVAEAETSTWSSSWPLLAEVKNARRGILLQPEPVEGETVLRTALPRAARSEFPPGRGYLVASGKATRVQLPRAAAPTASTIDPAADIAARS